MLFDGSHLSSSDIGVPCLDEPPLLLLLSTIVLGFSLFGSVVIQYRRPLVVEEALHVGCIVVRSGYGALPYLAPFDLLWLTILGVIFAVLMADGLAYSVQITS